MAETKIVYHIGAEDTPYLVCIKIPPEEITLGDFAKEINKTSGYRYYFKTLDDDLVVKQEIKDESAILPCYRGRVVAWITPVTQLSAASNSNGRGVANGSNEVLRPNRAIYDDSDASSVMSDASSIMSSEIESTSDSTSVIDSDEERSRESRQRQRRRKRKKATKPPQRCSSYSSMTESSSSLNIITVTLDMEASSYLGFSIYSSSDDCSIPGIYVGQIYKGGAVEADGRISTNDLILNVNDISFEKIGNGEAAKILQEIAQKPGPIKLVVAKTNRDSIADLHEEADFTDADTISLASHASFTLDPTAKWIQQQQQQGVAPAGYGFNYNDPSYYPTNFSLYSTTGSESPAGSQIGGDTIRGHHQPQQPLTVCSKIDDVLCMMTAPNSGLEIKERTWLKVTIPNAFIGQDLVKWLKEHISGLSDHKDARGYASNMLKNGYINNTVNKSDKFSDQCYYCVGEGGKMVTNSQSAGQLQAEMQELSIEPSQRSAYNSWAGKAGSVRSHGSGGTMSSSSPRSAPRGMVTASSAGSEHGPPPYGSQGPPPSYHTYLSGKSGSQRSGFAPAVRPAAPPGNLSRHDSVSSLSSVYSQHSMLSMPGRPLGSTPSSVAGSQASFRLAMDNAVEYYSDAV